MKNINNETDVLAAINKGNKVAAIKLLAKKSGISLKEAKNLIEAHVNQQGNNEELLKFYSDYRHINSIKEALKHYENFLIFLKKNFNELIIDEYGDLDEFNQNFQPNVSQFNNEKLSELYSQDHGLIIPDELNKLYAELGCICVNDEKVGFGICRPDTVFLTNGFKEFVSDADYFMGFTKHVAKEKCDFLKLNYCHIGTLSSFMLETYILLEKNGRGFTSITIVEDDLDESMHEAVESLCNPKSHKFSSLNEEIIECFYSVTYQLMMKFDLEINNQKKLN